MSSILKVDTIQDQSGNNIINENADTITIGASGDTISIPAGATLVNNGTASGFGLTWQSVQTTGFTAVKGNAYPCNTTSAEFTVTLPATPSAGDQVQLVDYAGTFDTNKLIIDGNGEDIEGSANNFQLTGEREGVILTYIDSTQGWIATSGINEGTDALDPETYSIDFLVIAGGASGGVYGGGGGAGGYRTSTQLVGIGTAITVTVGDGGAAVTGGSSSGNNGSDSSISGSGLTTITSTGGGKGGGNTINGFSGGSGGGGGNSSGTTTGGAGNTPSTAPSQGNNGGNGGAAAPAYGGGGGGGAGAVGQTTPSSSVAGAGGNGTASSITGSSVTRAGGGGGGAQANSAGAGGTGGGGAGSVSGTATSGTANTGGGGGGNGDNGTSGAGGKGVVILSMPLAKFSGTVTGSPTESTVSGTTKVLVYNGTGSYTA